MATDVGEPPSLASKLSAGFLLRLSGVYRQGEAVHASWKGWARQGESHFRWEFRRILPGLIFDESPTRPLKKVLQESFHRWEETAHRFGFEINTHLRRSARSIAQRGGLDEVSNTDEQEAWVSTLVLLLLLCDWRMKARGLDKKAKIDCLFRLLVERCAPVAPFRDESHWEVGERISGKCAKELVDGRCKCLHDLFAARLPRQDDDISHQWYSALVIQHLLSHNTSECDAITAWVLQKVIKLANAMEGSVAEWAAFDWHLSDEAVVHGLLRKRRLDFHARQFCLQGSVMSGRASTSAEAGRAMGAVSSASQPIAWRAADLQALRASSRMSFSNSQVLSCAVDGARIGRPLVEMLLGLISDARGNRHCVLPPQANRNSQHPQRAKDLWATRLLRH